MLRVHAGEIAVELGTVSIGDQTWLTDPLTGRWHELRAGSGFNPAVLFDPDLGWVALLTDLDRSHPGRGGRRHPPPLRPGPRRNGWRRITAGLAAGQSVVLDLWLDAATFRIVRLEFSTIGDEGQSDWVIVMSDFDAPVADRSSGGRMTARRRPSPAAVLAVVCFGVFVAADDLTVVSTMLRQIIGDLNIPLPDGWDRAAWIVNSYLVAYVAVMPFMGRLSDVLGRRRVFVGALVLFIAGSAWTPFAGSLGPFIVARILTAAGGGAMVPVALAAVGDAFSEERRPGALGVLGAVDTIGWVWGPLFGALLVRFLNWRWQFYLNIPLGLVAMAAAWWALQGLDRPAAPPPHRLARGHLSLGGAHLPQHRPGQHQPDLRCRRPGGTDRAPLPADRGPSSWRSPSPWRPSSTSSAAAPTPSSTCASSACRTSPRRCWSTSWSGAALIIAMVDVPLFVNLVVETGLQRAPPCSAAGCSAP